MARPEMGKKYLIVFCKSCTKAFRVIDREVALGEKLDITQPKSLKCRGCGAVSTYDPKEMRVATVGPKPKRA